METRGRFPDALPEKTQQKAAKLKEKARKKKKSIDDESRLSLEDSAEEMIFPSPRCGGIPRPAAGTAVAAESRTTVEKSRQNLAGA